MMTVFSLILLLAFDCNPDIKQVVQEYHQLENEASEISFIHKYHESKDASVMAYVTSIAMKQAEYSPNPLRKLQLFQENKTSEMCIKGYKLQNPQKAWFEQELRNTIKG